MKGPSHPRSPRGLGRGMWREYKRAQRAEIAEKHGTEELKRQRRREKRLERFQTDGFPCIVLTPEGELRTATKRGRLTRHHFQSLSELQKTNGISPAPLALHLCSCFPYDCLLALRLAAIDVPLKVFGPAELKAYAFRFWTRAAEFTRAPTSDAATRNVVRLLRSQLALMMGLVGVWPLGVCQWFAALSILPVLILSPDGGRLVVQGPLGFLLGRAVAVYWHLQRSGINLKLYEACLQVWRDALGCPNAQPPVSFDGIDPRQIFRYEAESFEKDLAPKGGSPSPNTDWLSDALERQHATCSDHDLNDPKIIEAVSTLLCQDYQVVTLDRDGQLRSYPSSYDPERVDHQKG